MKIAIAQTRPVKGNIAENIQNHIYWINKAAKEETDLIVFPELSLTGYESELAPVLATNQEDERLLPLQRLSIQHNMVIAVGMPTRKDQDLFISMLIFQPKSEPITYSKQYLYHTEVSTYTAATNPTVVKIKDEIVAPAICYELSNSPHHNFAFKNDATVYMASVLNSVEGVDGDIKKLAGIAKKYKVISLMANYVGISGGYKCGGRSSVWNTKGELTAQLDDKNEGILFFDTFSGIACTTP